MSGFGSGAGLRGEWYGMVCMNLVSEAVVVTGCGNHGVEGDKGGLVGGVLDGVGEVRVRGREVIDICDGSFERMSNERVPFEGEMAGGEAKPR